AGARLVREGEAVARKRRQAGAAEGVRAGVVIAGEPGPAGLPRQLQQAGAVIREQGGGALVAVEAVAERDDLFGAGAGEVGSEPPERHAGVVGRQQLPAARIGGELLEMQVGDQQRLAGTPVETARRQRLEALAGEMQQHARHLLRRSPFAMGDLVHEPRSMQNLTTLPLTVNPSASCARWLATLCSSASEPKHRYPCARAQSAAAATSCPPTPCPRNCGSTYHPSR